VSSPASRTTGVTQLFSSRFGFFFRLGLLAVLSLAIIGVFVWRAVVAEPAPVDAGLEQAVPFSHKHHVGDDGIDCRYCHSSVENSAFAGIPPLSTCMTCHSQLYTDQPALAPLIHAFERGVAFRWQRVHQLPDFVYFNHGIHIAKGVGCSTCHGAIDAMPLTARVAPLTMQWCLECHRAPQRYLRPRSAVFDLHWQAKDQLALGQRLMRDYHIEPRRLTECSVCHR
jgi:hypothetical protein